jgi:hypothetical protein
MRTNHTTALPVAFEYERKNTVLENGRDMRFPPGWWIVPAIMPSLILIVWLAIKLI